MAAFQNPLVLICLGCDHKFTVDGSIPDIHSRDSEDARCPKCYRLDTTTEEGGGGPNIMDLRQIFGV